MRKLILSMISAGLVLGSINAYAQSKNVLDLLKAGGAKVVKTIDVNPFIKGHLVEFKTGEKNVLFTDASGQIAIDGKLINYDGSVLNEKYLDILNPPKDLSSIKPYIDSLETIDMGDSTAPTLYMLTESLCPACAEAHDMFNKMGLKGSKDVNVRMIPVSFHSGAKEIWGDIYSKKDRLQALENDFKKIQFGQKPEMAVGIPSKTLKTLDGANTVMRDMRASATPTFFYEHNGKLVKFAGVDPVKMQKAIIDLSSQKEK